MVQNSSFTLEKALTSITAISASAVRQSLSAPLTPRTSQWTENSTWRRNAPSAHRCSRSRCFLTASSRLNDAALVTEESRLRHCSMVLTEGNREMIADVNQIFLAATQLQTTSPLQTRNRFPPRRGQMQGR